MRTLLRALAGPAGLSVAGQAGSAALGFLSFVLLARLLGPGDLGAWVLYLTAATLLDMLRAGVVQTAMVRLASHEGAVDVRSVYGSAWVLSIGITVVLAGGTIAVRFLAGSPADSGTLGLFVTWWPLVAVAGLPGHLAAWILQARRRFGAVAAVRLTQSAVFLAAIAVLFTGAPPTPGTVAAVQAGATAAGGALALVTGWAAFSSIRWASLETIRSLFTFGKFSMGTLIGTNLLKSADAFILGAFLGPAAVAFYAVPQKLVEAIEIPLRGLASAAFPEMSEYGLRKEYDRLRIAFERWVGLLTLGLLPVVSIAWWLAPRLLVWMGGAEYADGVWLLRLFLLYILLLPADRYLGLALDALGKPHLNLIKVILMVTVNVAGDLFSVAMWGSVEGVALTTVVMTLFGTLIGATMLNRYITVRPLDVLVRGWGEGRRVAAAMVGST